MNNASNLQTVIGLLENKQVPIADIVKTEVRPPFDEGVMAFVGALSGRIMRTPEARKYPEIISLAYWMRPSALKAFEKDFRANIVENCLAAPRGMALHFAPANVDTIFLYSCVLSLLAGNANVVRISQSRQNVQTEILLNILRDMLMEAEWASYRNMLRFITYPHDATLTEELSRHADLRIIWGGDTAVAAVKRAPLSPLSKDITFPDRWSVSVLDAQAVASLGDAALQDLARDFANDGYWFHQMACSSPRSVIWRGSDEDSQPTRTRFWEAVRTQASRFAEQFSETDYYRKRLDLDTGVLSGNFSCEQKLFEDNLTTVILTDAPEMLKNAPYSGGGMFTECVIHSLSDLTGILDRRCQTIGSFGISDEAWRHFLVGCPRIVDRVVPIGQALNFGAVWDGMNLISEMTRLVQVSVGADF